MLFYLIHAMQFSKKSSFLQGITEPAFLLLKNTKYAFYFFPSKNPNCLRMPVKMFLRTVSMSVLCGPSTFSTKK